MTNYTLVKHFDNVCTLCKLVSCAHTNDIMPDRGVSIVILADDGGGGCTGNA